MDTADQEQHDYDLLVEELRLSDVGLDPQDIADIPFGETKLSFADRSEAWTLVVEGYPTAFTPAQLAIMNTMAGWGLPDTSREI